MYRRLLPFLRPHAWLLAAAMGCTIGAALLDAFSLALLIPFLNSLFGEPSIGLAGGWVSDLLHFTVGAFLDPADQMGSLRNVIMVMVATMLAKNALVWAGGQLGAAVQEYVTRDLRNALYGHLVRLPLSFFSRMKGGQILSRVLNDTAETRLVLTQILTQSLQSGAMVLAYLAFLLGLSWRLTLITFLVAPLLIGALQPLLKRLRVRARRRVDLHGEMSNVLQETIAGVRLVKSFSAERYEQRRFEEGSERFARSTIRVTRLSVLASPITEVLGTIVALTLLWIGAREVLVEGTMAGADLIAFLLYVLRLLSPLKQLSQVRTVAQSSFASAERIFEVLDITSEPQRDRGERHDVRFTREISFEHVSFAYETEPVLRDITFTAPKGKVIALVGPSGAGKSTLVDLIPRFHEPTEGRITVDGVDTRDIALPALRSLTGIVSQDTVLFNDTVRNNIAYGTPGRHSDEQVEAAARAANAHLFIQELPDGYQTLLGERGLRLSGGQRQRIAIARALLYDPPILILDEATSALDTESERLIQEALDRLLEGRTVFVIAHRLSTIAHADEILVLDRGVILERGAHEELLTRGGLYQRLYDMQFARPALATAPTA